MSRKRGFNNISSKKNELKWWGNELDRCAHCSGQWAQRLAHRGRQRARARRLPARARCAKRPPYALPKAHQSVAWHVEQGLYICGIIFTRYILSGITSCVRGSGVRHAKSKLSGKFCCYTSTADDIRPWTRRQWGRLVSCCIPVHNRIWKLSRQEIRIR